MIKQLRELFTWIVHRVYQKFREFFQFYFFPVYESKLSQQYLRQKPTGEAKSSLLKQIISAKNQLVNQNHWSIILDNKKFNYNIVVCCSWFYNVS